MRSLIGALLAASTSCMALVALAGPPSDIAQALRSAEVTYPIGNWSTAGKGLPSPNFHDTAGAARAHVIAHSYKRPYCGVQHRAMRPKSIPVNGEYAVYEWEVWYEAYEFRTVNDTPVVHCLGTYVLQTIDSVGREFACDSTSIKLAWFEDAAGNAIGDGAPGRARQQQICTRALPNVAACPPATAGGAAPRVTYGNPVDCATQTKIQVETDLPALTPGGLGFSRTLRSNVAGAGTDYHLFGATLSPGATQIRCIPGVYVRSDGVRVPACFPLATLWEASFLYRGADGLPVRWWAGASGLTAPGFVNERVIPRPATGGADVVSPGNHVEQFDSRGRFLARRFADGRIQLATYSDAATPASVAPRPDMLIAMTDTFGRTLQFRYDCAGALSRVIGVGGEELVYTADPHGNLTSVRYPDGTQRTYLFNEPAQLSNVAREGHLTGIVDENGDRASTFTYDANGLAIATERAGGVDRFTFSYGQVTTPLGEQLNYIWNSNSGTTRKIRATSVTRSCAGCSSASATFTYDANSNPTSSTSFSGSKSCYTHDARNLEVLRLEGLASSASCPADLAAYPVPAGTSQRKIWTAYHPYWRFPVRIAEPGKITTIVYNGQPDPTAGNATLACAPASATVIDNLPIAVVCRRIEVATTDLTGTLGFGTAQAVTVPARIWSYTYNAQGQVLTVNGPRTDTSDVTTYAYYDTTGVDFTTGDLRSVTNALSHVVRFDRYNRHGQVLQMTDPNGVVTGFSYDARQRLKSVTTGGQTLSYDYKPTGQVSRITQPGGQAYVEFEYDTAPRLVGVKDQLGNRIDHVLDAAGNSKTQTTKDPAGVLRRQVARSFDPIGMLRQITGRE